MIRFLAAGMTAVTITGAAVAFAPAKNVYAAETSAEDSESIRENKIMSVKEADDYLNTLLGNTKPYQEYDNIKMYQVGDQAYSITLHEMESAGNRWDCGFSCTWN